MEFIYAESGAIVSTFGDPRLLQITLQNDAAQSIMSENNGGILQIQYNVSATDASRRILDASTSFGQAQSKTAYNAARARALTTSTEGNIVVLECSFTNISAGNGGLIYEMTPINTVLINVTSNDFDYMAATSRGGVFFLNQPDLLVEGNNFNYITAVLAGPLSYSVTDQVNVSGLATSNDISPPISVLASFGPTNLRVVFKSIVDGTVMAAEDTDSLNPLVPIVYNLTSYSLSDFMMSFTLVYQPDDTNFKNYIIVPDPSTDFLLTIDFYFGESAYDRSYVTENCSNSVCTTLASSIVLEGLANDTVNVSVSYVSDTYNQSQNFSIILRSCVPGEIFDDLDGWCVYCSSGTYSLDTSDKSCEDCPNGATCLGGASIIIKPSYYRSTVNTSLLQLVPCNDSASKCLGGYLQTNCSDVYTGVTCSQCNLQNSYLSSGKEGTCTLCLGKAKLIAYAILTLFGTILYQLMMIMITYKENKAIHEQSVLDQQEKDTQIQNKIEDTINIVIPTTSNRIRLKTKLIAAPANPTDMNRISDHN